MTVNAKFDEETVFMLFFSIQEIVSFNNHLKSQFWINDQV